MCSREQTAVVQCPVVTVRQRLPVNDGVWAHVRTGSRFDAISEAEDAIGFIRLK